MESYVSRPGKLKASSAAEIRRHVNRVFAAWKDKPIVAITEADVRKRYGEMASKGLNGKRGAPGQANLSMMTLRALVNYAGRRVQAGRWQSAHSAQSRQRAARSLRATEATHPRHPDWPGVRRVADAHRHARTRGT